MKCPKCFKRRWFYFFIIIIAIIAFVLFKQAKKKSENGFETYTVQTKDLRETITASGQITAAEKAILKFQTSGRLAWVGVKKGDYVEKWQAIASLDQRQLEKSLKQELIDYQNQRITFDANIDDNEAGITSRNYLDIQTRGDEDLSLMRLLQQSQLNLDRTILDVEIAEIARQYAHLYSPIKGIVIEATDENAGVNISALSTQYTIVNPDTLRFSAEVEELDIAKVYEGQKAIINLDAFEDEEIPSTISQIEFSATQNISGNTVFVVNLPLNTNGKYRLDMNGDVEIITSEVANALTIPIEAVEEIEDKKYVQLIKDNQKIQTEIKTGIETDDYYEILEGLDFDDQIVIVK